MRRIRIGLAQINATVGDLVGNAERIIKSIEEAKSYDVDLVAFPELAVCGFPPEDLLLKPIFIHESKRYLSNIAENSCGMTIILGCIGSDKAVHNSAAIIHDNKIIDIYHKMRLQDGIFSEYRYFKPGMNLGLYVICGVNIGICIGDEIWNESGPSAAQINCGAELIINTCSSPYTIGKRESLEKKLKAYAASNLTAISLCNMVGGQDGLVFDGNSMLVNKTGQIITRGKQFAEDLIICDIDADDISKTRSNNTDWDKGKYHIEEKIQNTKTMVISENLSTVQKAPVPERKVEKRNLEGEIYDALVLGTRDYAIKNHFEKVVLGLSGGIDSSLVAAIASDALAPDCVIGVAMPSEYTTEGSVTDAQNLAKNLGIRLITIPIDKAFGAFLEMLKETFMGNDVDLTEENLQARIRANILMALSNKFNWLVLTTGNKSELATGYSTLYGDMAGGFAVIKDIPKTLVYEIARYRNSLSEKEVIPSTVLSKEPSAELRPDQRDSDSLPLYDVLDPILSAYVEDDKTLEQIVDSGFDQQTVKNTVRLVDTSEYKRFQAPPGIKITSKAFGFDRRMPITNWFKEW